MADVHIVYKIFVHTHMHKGKVHHYLVRAVMEIDGEATSIKTKIFPGTNKGNNAMRDWVAHGLACNP